MGSITYRKIDSWYRWVATLLLTSAAMTAHAMSEEEEIELGQKEHQKIISQFGVYRDQSLQQYITMVGERVARQSSRPDFKFHFTVLNDDMINAFALPGGFVYITRGMLMHMNSESELAAVLGHEVAHITERHAIRRQNRARLQNAGIMLGTILTGQPAVMELGSIFGGVLLTGYSREFELEADQVGAQYMAKAGYSPTAMLDTIEILKNKDRIEIEQARLEKRQPAVYHGFLSTHPDHDTRYKEAIEESQKLVEDYDEFIKTDEFLEKLNGLAYGPARQPGVIRGNRFYHSRLGIKFTFPDNWRLEPSLQGVQLISQVGDAAFYLGTERLYSGATPENMAKEKLGLDVQEGKELTIGGYPAYLGVAKRADSPFGPRPVRFAVLFDNRRRIAFVLKGAGKHDLSKIASDREFITTIFSFGPMDRDDHAVAKTPRIQVVRAEENTTMAALAEESAITNYALDKLRVMNGLYPHGEPEPGQLIKIVD